MNCCPVARVSRSSPSALSEASLWGLASGLYARGSVSPFGRPLWGWTKRAPPGRGALNVMALLILSPKACFPAPTPTFLCFWVAAESLPPIARTGPTLTATAGPQVLFFLRASGWAWEASVAAGWPAMSMSAQVLGTLGRLCECSLKLLNWSMNSSQCSRWCSGSQVSSLLPYPFHLIRYSHLPFLFRLLSTIRSTWRQHREGEVTL